MLEFSVVLGGWGLVLPPLPAEARIPAKSGELALHLRDPRIKRR